MPHFKLDHDNILKRDPSVFHPDIKKKKQDELKEVQRNRNNHEREVCEGNWEKLRPVHHVAYIVYNVLWLGICAVLLAHFFFQGYRMFDNIVGDLIVMGADLVINLIFILRFCFSRASRLSSLFFLRYSNALFLIIFCGGSSYSIVNLI